MYHSRTCSITIDTAIVAKKKRATFESWESYFIESQALVEVKISKYSTDQRGQARILIIYVAGAGIEKKLIGHLQLPVPTQQHVLVNVRVIWQ